MDLVCRSWIWGTIWSKWPRVNTSEQLYLRIIIIFYTYFKNAWPRAKAQFVPWRQVCSDVMYIIYYIHMHYIYYTHICRFVCTKRTIFTCYPVILTYTNYGVRRNSKNNHPAARPVKIYIISKRMLQLQVLFKKKRK